ncbi:WGR domain-containing protein [Aquamicrobium zhengzhouense]|uniref:WGR domain-containing protein n=1 Tax=Aquamicrobium zhengzhouense TaxID=2781738 RepID=A0ABS0SHI0_9HYPH|nr:WGR domain-containing protein [Aquamicrobium zhengzhouense]MBI1622758.1 WGR domain-containing protein [Aquamicrobium zhengzhouense]
MTILMHRIDPAANAYRFYALSLEPTLFGDVALVRRWGRIGTTGRQIIELHPDAQAAERAWQAQLKRRTQRGYWTV